MIAQIGNTIVLYIKIEIHEENDEDSEEDEHFAVLQRNR